MGAWDVGAFDNDEAIDWVSDLIEQDDPALITGVIQSIVRLGESEEYLEADLCNEAIAAMEVLAALKGSSAPDFPEEVQEWVSRHSPPSPDLVKLALQALHFIRTDSELKELWQETDYFADWNAFLDELENRLKSE
ncbi:MAG: DUF4259 domain-containing protein [Fimbriimonadales bacterium]